MFKGSDHSLFTPPLLIRLPSMSRENSVVTVPSAGVRETNAEQSRSEPLAMSWTSDARLWAGRRRWDLVRFGMTPRGLATRIRPGDSPKVFATSIPKAGTHLRERSLCLHPRLHRSLNAKVLEGDPEIVDELLGRTRPGQVVVGHVNHSQKIEDVITANRAVSLFIVRDPRDIVVSHAHYIKNFKGHEWHHMAAGRPDLESRIRLFIEGDESAGIEPIGEVLESFSGWLDRADVVVRFEELVAPEARARSIARLFEGLDMPLDYGRLGRIATRIVSPVSVTFRNGRSGEGRQRFDDELERLYLQSAGPYLERFGYGEPASPEGLSASISPTDTSCSHNPI